MTNNDILRRIRYTFDYNDDKMITIFALANQQVSRSEVSAWLKRDDAEGFQSCQDSQLAAFLNGLIVDRRGDNGGTVPPPDKKLNNNLIFKKLKIALNLHSEDILEMLQLVDVTISAHELSAFFRKPGHKHYRECKDQILRNFISAMQQTYRPDVTKATTEPVNVWK